MPFMLHTKLFDYPLDRKSSFAKVLASISASIAKLSGGVLLVLVDVAVAGLVWTYMPSAWFKWLFLVCYGLHYLFVVFAFFFFGIRPEREKNDELAQAVYSMREYRDDEGYQ